MKLAISGIVSAIGIFFMQMKANLWKKQTKKKGDDNESTTLEYMKRFLAYRKEMIGKREKSMG